VKTLGLIGGMSWESTTLYYQLLNRMARDRLGGQHSAKLILWSVDFAPVAAMQSAGLWDEATSLMVDAARRLETAGAEAIVICANTMHKMADAVQAEIGVPLLHIADATGAAIQASSSRRPALLATRYTMEQNFIRDRLLDRSGVETLIPDEADRLELHRIIYEELCLGVVTASSKAAFLAMIAKLRADGADGVILGCTELGLLLTQDQIDIPVFDTAILHAQAGVDFALQ